MAVGDKNSLNRLVSGLLVLSPRYVMVTCLTHGNNITGRVGWGVGCRGGVGGGEMDPGVGGLGVKCRGSGSAVQNA